MTTDETIQTPSCEAFLLPGIPVMPEPEPIPTDPEEYNAWKEAGLLLTRWNTHPLGETLTKNRIMADTTLPRRDFLFRIFGKSCFRQGEMVAVTGKAKSGKTFFCSSLIVAALSGSCLDIRRQSDKPLRILWIDTEQSEDSTQDILTERIIPMTGMTKEDVEKSLYIINLRATSWKRRFELVRAAMEICQPQLVLFDGIRDVVNDINDQAMAQEVVDECLALASKWSLCLVCVLHQNKAVEDKTLRGAIGTELSNKSFETFECRKMEDYTFQVEQTATRKYDIRQRLRFEVNEQGLPEMLGAMPSTGAMVAEAAVAANQFNTYLKGPGQLDTEKIFGDIFSSEEELRAYALRQAFMSRAHVSEATYLQYLRDAMNRGLVRKHIVSDHEVYYRLGSPVAQTPSTADSEALAQLSLFDSEASTNDSSSAPF